MPVPSRPRSKMTTFVLSTLVLAVTSSGFDGVLYVDDDAPPGGDGLLWATAYRHLQDALFHAREDDGAVTEIRVAAGVYRPDQDERGRVAPGDRFATFAMAPGVAHLGGFAGLGAADPNARHVGVTTTTLSGDLGGTNSLRVVTGAGGPETVLDGFVVRDGVADLNDPYDKGAGFWAEDASPTLRDCTFRDNESQGGGPAVSFNRTSTRIVDCRFFSNRSLGFGFGGAARLALCDGSILEDCVFAGNLSEERAGAVSIRNNSSDSVSLLDCRFSENFAREGAGAVYVFQGGANIRRCEFRDNEADFGGGGAVSSVAGKIVIEDSIIEDNVAPVGGAVSGGAGQGGSAAKFTLRNTIVRRNEATRGGGLWISRNSVIPSNPNRIDAFQCLFTENTATTGDGGAAYNDSTITMTNCAVVANTADDEAGGIFEGFSNTVETTLHNCVLWLNTAGEAGGEAAQLTSATGVIEASFCCIQDYAGGATGPGNFDGDPLFVDADYRLGPGSSCVDAGRNWSVPLDEDDVDGDGNTLELSPVDLDGNPRFSADGVLPDPGCGVPVVVDVGPYELQVDPAAGVLFGDVSGNGNIDFEDLLAVLSAWGACADPCCLADLDLDGTVGLDELLLILSTWGAVL